MILCTSFYWLEWFLNGLGIDRDSSSFLSISNQCYFKEYVVLRLDPFFFNPLISFKIFLIWVTCRLVLAQTAEMLNDVLEISLLIWFSTFILSSFISLALNVEGFEILFLWFFFTLILKWKSSSNVWAYSCPSFNISFFLFNSFFRSAAASFLVQQFFPQEF